MRVFCSLYAASVQVSMHMLEQKGRQWARGLFQSRGGHSQNLGCLETTSAGLGARERCFQRRALDGFPCGTWWLSLSLPPSLPLHLSLFLPPPHTWVQGWRRQSQAGISPLFSDASAAWMTEGVLHGPQPVLQACPGLVGLHCREPTSPPLTALLIWEELCLEKA